MPDLVLVVPVNVTRSARQVLPCAGQVDEAPGIDEEVGAAQDLDNRLWKYQSNNLLKPDNCFEGLGWIVNSVQSSQWKEMKYHSLLWRICISFQLLTVHRGLNQGGDR